MDPIRTSKSINVRIFKKTVKFLFFLICGFPFCVLYAQWEDSTTLKNLDYSIQTGILSNDLKVVYLKNPNSPLATIEWSLFPGTIVQKAEFEGMLALLDKFFLRTTQKDNSPIQFQNRISDIGLSNESEILTESIHFQWVVPNKYLRDGLILLKDCWFYPKWIDLEFQREKILLAKQIQQSEQTPSWFLYREMMLKVLGQKDVSRQTIAADYYNIQKIDLQQLKDFKNQYFSPQNTVLSISSSYDFSTIMHWSDSLFSDWSNSKTFSVKDSLKFDLKHNASAFKITSEKTQVPIVAVSFPFQDSLNFKNYIIGNLIAQIFNSKYSQIGKFFYKNDLGYQLLCNYRPSILFSEFLFSIAIKREKLDYAMDFIRHFQVYAYHANWINSRDLELAKTLLKTDYFIQNQTPWLILHKISQSFFMFQSLDYLHYLDTLEAITIEDLQSFFQKSINIPNPIVGFLMNSEDVKGSEIEKKLEDFWLQPFGPVYDLIDPDHNIIPLPEIKTPNDTIFPNNYVSIDTSKVVSQNSLENQSLATQNSLNNNEINEVVFDKIITEKDKIYFEFGSSIIDKPSQLILEKFAKDLQSNSIIKLKLTGHTDSSGPEDFNLKLSLQRANKVKEFLVSKYKISSERIKTEGLGESQLAFPEDTPQNRAKNRRVEVEVFVE